MAICTVQVTNVSPSATFQNIKELFSYFGDIDELKVFPEDEEKKDIPSKVCFVTFKERSSLETALHLTNTILIDRALVVSQSRYEVIPEESTAMSLAAPAVAIALPDQVMQNTMSVPLLPTPTLNIPQTPSLLGTPSQQPLLQNPLVTAMQQAQSVASSINANIEAVDDPLAPQQPALINAAGSLIPPTPNLTGNVDPTKIDEIRRTIYVGNLNSTLTADQVMNFFQTCGEIKYVRMAGDETQPARFAFVEFANPESVQIALQYNGAMFGDRPVKVNHSKNAIVKPQGKTPEMAQKEVDEAMKKVREATQAISTTIVEPVKSRSRSRSRSRDRRRSRDRGYRHRSGSRDRYRRRSYSRSPHRRRHYSPSPRQRDYRRNNWRDRRSRSRSPVRYRGSHSSFRHRSPDRDRRHRRSRTRSRSRSPSPHRHRRGQRDKDERSRDRTRKQRSPSQSPSPDRKRNKKSKKEKKRHKRSPSPEDFDEQHSEGASPLGSPVQGADESSAEEEEAGSSMSD